MLVVCGIIDIIGGRQQRPTSGISEPTKERGHKKRRVEEEQRRCCPASRPGIQQTTPLLFLFPFSAITHDGLAETAAAARDRALLLLLLLVVMMVVRQAIRLRTPTLTAPPTAIIVGIFRRRQPCVQVRRALAVELVGLGEHRLALGGVPVVIHKHPAVVSIARAGLSAQKTRCSRKIRQVGGASDAGAIAGTRAIGCVCGRSSHLIGGLEMVTMTWTVSLPVFFSCKEQRDIAEA